MAEPLPPYHLLDPSAPPDLMNDPQYATNTLAGEDGAGDPDTCRICRGEASDKEPLFHPCKCSGSIKHVHQDCLMEWLSHSQKKHCELCKTPFRFTKLYSPNMPQSLPPGVFLRHSLLHSIRNIGTWLRFCLVVTVWLGCLPYVIRQVWRLLFWFSDGGLPSNYTTVDMEGNSSEIMELAAQLHLAARQGRNGTSPVIPFHASTTTPAAEGSIWTLLMRFSQALNLTEADPLAVGLFKSLYYGLGLSFRVLPHGHATNVSVPGSVIQSPVIARDPSLLSNVPFLSNMTRNAYVNQIAVTVAEGYVITLLVVVSFILVFLIREWVVQQQFGANMRAGFNPDFAAPDRPGERDQAPPAAPEEPAPANVPEPRDVGQRPIARPRRRNVQFDDAEAGGARRPRRAEPGDARLVQEAGEGQRQHRPAPVRDALTPATEIQRQLTEEPRRTEEFLAIWRRSDSDPTEVLRIIEEENKGDEMRYWVNAMKTLQAHTPMPSTIRALNGGLNRRSDPIDLDDNIEGSAEAQAKSDQSRASSDSWVDVSNSVKHSAEENLTADNAENAKSPPLHEVYDFSPNKGKGKEVEESPQPLSQTQPPEDLWNASSSSNQFQSFGSGISRPRAVSDGPQRKDSISPLANNNWSFKNLPDAGTEVTDLQLLEPSEKPMVAENTHSFTSSHASGPDDTSLAESSQRNENLNWREERDIRIREVLENHKAAEQPPSPAATPNLDPDLYGPIEIKGLDGVVRTAQSWDEVFDNNPLTDSEDEAGEHGAAPEPNPFHPDVPLPEAREPVVARPAEPHGLLANVADWLWGGIEDVRPDEGANDEHVVEDLAAEPPFVPVDNHGMFEQGDFAEQDREVAEAAFAAGIDPNDPDAIDEADDFEGIMELIGMRGPIFSLAQSALFSALLLALTVAFGVWIPYNIGRVSVLLIANPGPACKLPLSLVFWIAAFLQDFAASVLGVLSYCLIAVLLSPVKLLNAIFPGEMGMEVGFAWGSAALRISNDAVERIFHSTVDSLLSFKDSDIFTFSAASHESLLTLGSLARDIVSAITTAVMYPFVERYTLSLSNISGFLTSCLHRASQLISDLRIFLTRPDSWVISLEVAKRTTPLDPGLSVWNGVDRFWATIAGYTTLIILGAMYVKKGTPFSNGPVGREWEATIIDLLHQAGGVMKVILIISIEMLVFPLYCGLLLDAALLPLFDNATITSRVQFTVRSPLTSIFVHWFVGTCYMFHFALFVSMCRKIMRKGVLYFIRDPDDPTFHPVRDVLERSVATQLRKILFSALVYGALVVICLGGVVWGLSSAFRGVLPIHWSSNEPVLEFPIDLLFYNFLMPLAVKFFKPSDGLHAMYSWWFRQCARMLRLTWFLFDERRLDEEGYNVRRTWSDVLRCAKGDPLNVVETEDPRLPFIADPEMVVYFRHNGRYVRVPASDQVRIPKGNEIFLSVDANNNRIDGKPDSPDGIHGRHSELYKQVYIPPHFSLRIAAFILSIWIFAALTGVCITIVPLVFGRHIFSRLLPSHVRKNDVYAFSIGIYILGSALYGIIHLRRFVNYLISSAALTRETPQNVLRRLTTIISRVARVLWTYSAVIFLLPTLYAFVIEFYAILPLHTYFAADEPHTIHFVQSWTLGLLYVKLTSRVILFYSDSRPAISLHAITRDGYLNPDAKLATRAFILPGSLLLGFALFFPWCVARLAILTVFRSAGDEQKVRIYRYVYPAVLAMAFCCWLGWLMIGMVRVWRSRIRDEVYLIGERLHNFGERKAAGSGVGIGVRRIET